MHFSWYMRSFTKWPIIISIHQYLQLHLLVFRLYKIKLTGNSFFKTSFLKEILHNLKLNAMFLWMILKYRELVSFINEDNKFIYRFAFSDRTKF